MSNKSQLVIRYRVGLSESIKNICNKHGIPTHFISCRKLKTALSSFRRSGVTTRLKCDRVDFYHEYVGESGRIFGEFQGISESPIPIHDHQKKTGHLTAVESFSILGSEVQNLTKILKNQFS